jgi:protease-4
MLTLAALSAGTVSCSFDDDDEDDALKVATLLELDLRTPLSERGEAFFAESSPSLWSAVSRVRGLADEPLARGLFVRLGSMSGHFADVEEWASAFETLRAQKKPVHCHFDDADNAGYALAAHCDRITMTPSGSLDLVGLAMQAVHGRTLLESMGIQADLLQIGQYKGAAEPFTRDEMSPQLRQNLDGLLTDFDTRFRKHLTDGRKLSADAVAHAIDVGPHTSQAAQTLKLVDALSYDDEARTKAREAAKAERVKELFPSHEQGSLSFKELIEAFTGEKRKAPKGTPRLALVTLTGEIAVSDRIAPDRAASEPFVRAMRKLSNDDDVKAVVLRIESPGGSALASDRMWHAVRRVAKRKPVIATLGEVAASGGYYIASAATKILATDVSIVGSIGVVGGKIVVKGLADKVGVHVQTLSRGAHAAWLSPLAPFSESERATLETLMRDTYDRFLERVALGRGRTVDALQPAAEGRVMGGARAVALGLVDQVGGLAQAISLAKEAGKLPRDARIEAWPDADDPFRAISSMLGGAAAPDHALSELAREAGVSLKVPLVSAFEGGPPVAAVLPFDLRVR